MASALTAYLHYAAMMAIAVILIVQHMWCVPGLTGARIRLLAQVDRIYMVVAVLALASGAARVIWFGKGISFYVHNPVFYIKLALFAAVGLMSIPPTLQYLRWRHSLESTAPSVVADYQVRRIRRYIQVELVLFAFIPLMATFMARGIGMQAAVQ